jgi:hypothetical protein
MCCSVVLGCSASGKSLTLSSSEPRAPGAPSQMAATPRNPREEGKRGRGSRTRWGPVARGGSRRRRCDLLVLSLAPSDPVASLSPFPRPETRGTFVGENTRGWGLVGREVREWAGIFPKNIWEVNGLFRNFWDLVVGQEFSLPTKKNLWSKQGLRVKSEKNWEFLRLGNQIHEEGKP